MPASVRVEREREGRQKTDFCHLWYKWPKETMTRELPGKCRNILTVNHQHCYMPIAAASAIDT